MTNQIIIDANTVKLLSPACKAELAVHLGLSAGGASHTEDSETEETGEFAELGLQAARAFLRGCGEKTTEAIQRIVQAGDTFSLRKLEHDMGVPVGGLRGVWTGLTKRVHTITNNDNVDLIQWLEETDDDWSARLMPVTRESFRRALAE
ncbi:MAG: hypothetical protein V4579_00785 [Pseudomonadota bacterium]